MHPTDLTVAAIIRQEDRYLMVEEQAMGREVFSQPGGHIDAGESPEQAVVREVLEETGCTVRCGELVGVYLWIHPQTRQQFLRLVYTGEFLDRDPDYKLDWSIIRMLWMSRDDIERNVRRLRTPAVLRCIADFEQGRRGDDGLLRSMLPLQHNVHEVLARAELV